MAASDSLEDETVLLVIAIDVGTTYSGYAMSFASDKYHIHVSYAASSSTDPIPGCPQVGKVPTALLLKPNGTFEAFGFKALMRYTEIVDNNAEDQKTWMYFERFKMELHSKSNLSRHTMCKAKNGNEIDIITIFSHVMRYFKSEALEQIKSTSALEVDPDLVKWVITVPAIWSDGAKQIMREAAYKAGLTSRSNSKKLIVALEPEAAAVYCKSDKIVAPNLKEDQSTSSAFTLGTRYLLADIGGGTVDVTVHEVGENKKVRELHHATGGAWGGTYVDKNFVRLLKNIFGKALIKEFRSNHPCDWVDLVSKNFESSKRCAAIDDQVRVLLPFEFTEFFKKKKGCTVREHVKKLCNDDIYFNRGALALNYPEVAKLFNPIIENITSHLESILKKVEKIKYVILVGGFATCKLLQENIKKALASPPYSLKVLTACNCSLAVVIGSALFAHDPSMIASRRLKYSYGISCCLPFDKKLDPALYHFVGDDGVERCKDRFLVFAKINEEVEVGQEIADSFYPLHASNTAADVSVYTSTNSSTRYARDVDDAVKKVAKMILPLPKTEKGRDRRINVAMRFGETEIQVTSEDTSSGEKIEREIDLDFLYTTRRL